MNQTSIRQFVLVTIALLIAVSYIIPNPVYSQTPPPAPPVLDPSVSTYGTAPCNSSALPFPGPSFDPYAASSGYSQSPYSSDLGYNYYYNTNPGACNTSPQQTNYQKFIDAWLVRVLWMPGGQKEKKLGLTQLELNATFAFPLCFDPKNSLKVTPGFTFNWWNSDCRKLMPIPDAVDPDSGDPDYYVLQAMHSKRTYDAYLDFGWAPQLSDWISVDLGVRIGVYSDFHTVRGNAIRLTGHAVGNFRISQTWEARLGIDYINRVQDKILPVVGAVWTSPDGTMKLEAVFPYPKFSQKLPLADARNELWWYVRGEYGGGTWNVYTGLDSPYEKFTNVSYNDVRLAIGLDFEFINNIHGFFEVGGAFNRKVQYQHTAKFSLGDSFFLSGGLYF
ncbi:MAG: hypothetical protein IJQ39_05250 [Thermoguttaceae bacterium]|nr:hypothetical protein [Thermoguttaceae bacterium]